jgi:hypothetical protein
MSPTYQYTLYEAARVSGEPRLAAEAAAEVRRLAPTSSAGVIAEAQLALDHGNRRRFRWAPGHAAAIILVSFGSVLLPMGVMWTVGRYRARRHLRAAEALVAEALRLDPSSAGAQLLAAEIERARLRTGRSVDHQLSAAGIDAGAVPADRLIRQVATWLATATGTAWIVWLLVVDTVGDAVASRPAAAAVGVGLAVLTIAGVEQIGRRRSVPLPRPIWVDVHAHPAVLIAAGVVVVVLGFAGSVWFTHGAEEPTGYHLAALLSVPLALGHLVSHVARSGRRLGELLRWPSVR